MKIRVVIEYDEITKSYSANCPELPGCVSCGDTEHEALQNIKEAIVLYLEPVEPTDNKEAKIFELSL